MNSAKQIPLAELIVLGQNWFYPLFQLTLLNMTDEVIQYGAIRQMGLVGYIEISPGIFCNIFQDLNGLVEFIVVVDTYCKCVLRSVMIGKYASKFLLDCACTGLQIFLRILMGGGGVLITTQVF